MVMLSEYKNKSHVKIKNFDYIAIRSLYSFSVRIFFRAFESVGLFQYLSCYAVAPEGLKSNDHTNINAFSYNFFSSSNKLNSMLWM